MNMTDIEDVQRFLDDNFSSWVLDLGPVVTAAGPDGATLEIPITDAVARVGGIVSGQALATLADTAMVLACGAYLGQMVPVATITLDTQFLRPGSGDYIRAEAEITRAGRKPDLCPLYIDSPACGQTRRAGHGDLCSSEVDCVFTS